MRWQATSGFAWTPGPPKSSRRFFMFANFAPSNVLWASHRPPWRSAKQLPGPRSSSMPHWKNNEKWWGFTIIYAECGVDRPTTQNGGKWCPNLRILTNATNIKNCRLSSDSVAAASPAFQKMSFKTQMRSITSKKKKEVKTRFPGTLGWYEWFIDN